MEWNTESLLQKLQNVDDNLQKDNIEDVEQDLLEEQRYQIMKNNYKKFISSYSQAYIEMSDWYLGPELTREIYDNMFSLRKNNYLRKENIPELYGLFIFFTMLNASLQTSV